MIRVTIPYHLRVLAGVDGELQLDVAVPVTIKAVLDALEAKFPKLRGTIRDHTTLQRRAFIRFYACRQDLSNADPESLLPEAVQQGAEPLLVVGALAGG